MTEESPEKRVQAAVGAVGEIIKVAKESPEAREAGTLAAKSLVIIADTLHTVLLPLAAANYGAKKFAEYMKNRFGPELTEKTQHIPPEYVVAPRATVAGPTLDALVYAHEEDALRDLYLELLATAMDERAATAAHPAFVEILKQIDPPEIRLLRIILQGSQNQPIAEIRRKAASSGYSVLETHVLGWQNEGEPVEVPMGVAYVDNWARLGLVEISYDRQIAQEEAYEWVQGRPEYLRHAGDHYDSDIQIAPGVIMVTGWGGAFATAVGMSRSPVQVIEPSQGVAPDELSS
ncbi:DUF4393 domain-containing protein [Streptomyces sp. ISL-90]|nr:DUF4393 domain-containing protein [Streptomyces sp. ISL-90]